MWHRRSLVAIMLGLLMVGTACIPARAGTKCSSDDWGDDGSHVLRCIDGRWKRVMTRQQAIDALIAIDRESKKPPAGEVIAPNSLGSPVINNLADPTAFVENGTTYVYGTSNYRHVPVIALTNADAGTSQLAVEAMPTQPPWADTAEIWAPSVTKFANTYVMYFTGHRPGALNRNSAQCVGRALSLSPTGPFVPDAAPLNCGNDGVSGALDPSVFVDPAGAAHLLVAMGGSNVNLWSIPLDGAGLPSGPAVALLAREQPWQVWFLENPSMYFDGSTYLLAYSAGYWDSSEYRTGVARCASPAGPCRDHAAGPWLASIGDRVGPGGLSFFRGTDGAMRVAFHSFEAGRVGPVGLRSTHIRRFYTDPWPRLG